MAVNNPTLPLQPLCVGCRIKQLGKGHGSHGSIASVANQLHYDRLPLLLLGYLCWHYFALGFQWLVCFVLAQAIDRLAPGEARQN